MSKGSDRRRQKKLEQTRKKRADAKKQIRRRDAQREANLSARIRSAPFGPCWVSRHYDASTPIDAIDDAASLVVVVVTRQLGGLYLTESVMVDRTCLGIKDAAVLDAGSEFEVNEYAARWDVTENPLVRCEPALAQTVVFAALDYARSLGFSPHREFDGALFEPRPVELTDTSSLWPAMPRYFAGPRDDTKLVLQKLERAVGPNGYQAFAPARLPDSWFDGDDEFELDDEDGEWELDDEAEWDEVIDVPGSSELRELAPESDAGDASEPAKQSAS